LRLARQRSTIATSAAGSEGARGEARQRRVEVEQDRAQLLRVRGARGMHAGERAPEQDPECPEIRLMIDFVGAPLLG